MITPGIFPTVCAHKRNKNILKTSVHTGVSRILEWAGLWTGGYNFKHTGCP